VSGSGKPGATFKATVVSVSGDQAVIEGEAEDLEYLVAGREYVFHVTPVGTGHSDGDD
jgi:hypothetical protein